MGHLKKLKTEHSTKGDCMDLYDLANFYKFFIDLYSEQTISLEIVSHLITTTRITDHWRNESSAQWWSHRCRTIQKHPKAQKRKAAAEDELLNELFKCVTDDTKSVVLKVFNKCLKHGIHKKCSNLACYGDSGRCSLTIKISKQVVEYYNRLENLDAGQLSCKACFCRRKA